MKRMEVLIVLLCAWSMGVGSKAIYLFFDYQLNKVQHFIWIWPNLFIDFIPMVLLGAALFIHFWRSLESNGEEE